MAEEIFLPTSRGQLFVCRWSPETPNALTPPIVLVHDSLGVIAYDRLGFGRSDPHPALLTPPDFITDEAVGDFDRVLDHLNIKEFVVLGHSVGGGMGLGVAATVGSRCHALITISAQTFAEEKTLEGVRAAKEFFAVPEQVARISKYHGNKAPWILNAWIENWLSPAFDDWSLDAQIKEARCPILAIHGAEDEYGSQAHAERIAEHAVTPVTLCILEGEGHVPHRTSTKTVLATVKEFLAQT